ncbi:MAG TPA: hypothetical protein PK530_12055, partial [Anaerolineales bacterium]|nr:hypothetical protein [Anaerolineales bacterium]
LFCGGHWISISVVNMKSDFIIRHEKLSASPFFRDKFFSRGRKEPRNFMDKMQGRGFQVGLHWVVVTISIV